MNRFKGVFDIRVRAEIDIPAVDEEDAFDKLDLLWGYQNVNDVITITNGESAKVTESYIYNIFLQDNT